MPVCGTISIPHTCCAVLIPDGTRSRTVRVHERRTVPTLPTSGQGGYMTPAAWGVSTASERGDRIRIGPQVGKVATSPLPPRGSPPLQSGGTESEVADKWARWPHHPCRLGGSPPLHSGGTESEVAHKWARWLHHPCRLGVPTASQRGDRFKSGPQVGKVVTSPPAPRGSPPLQSGGQNQKWPTSGQGG